MGLAGAHQTRQASKLIEDLMGPVDELRQRVEQLEGIEGINYLKLSEANVSNPPTAAQLTALFGTPATVGKGFTSLINDNGAGANFYLVSSDGSNWWIFSGVKAV